MARKSDQLLTVRQVGDVYDRSPRTIDKYIDNNILVVHSRSPKDHVTRLLSAQSVEVRMRMFDWRKKPEIKRVNRRRAGKLLGQVCGETDEKLKRHLDRIQSSAKVVARLEAVLESILEG